MPSNIDIGAIRWDLWYDRSAGSPTLWTETALSDPAFQSRAPFFAEQRASGLLRMAPTQATMDAEIAAAVSCHLAYWAFYLYPTPNPGNAGWDLYQTSADKADMPWCSISKIGMLGTTGNYATEVAAHLAWFQQAHYYKTRTGSRPLLYLYYDASALTTYFGGSLANLKAAIDALRSATTGAGLANPYIVLMASSVFGSTVTSLGLDGLTCYVTNTPVQAPGTRAQLDAAAAADWAAQAVAFTTGVVPNIMCGWDRRPRIRRPAFWEIPGQRAWVGEQRYVAAATNAELIAHFQAAIDFILANPTACPMKLGITYAWNEHDEGGWLCPTLGDPPTVSQPGGARLAALAPTLA